MGYIACSGLTTFYVLIVHSERVVSMLMILVRNASCHCKIGLQEQMEAGTRAHRQTVAFKSFLKATGVLQTSHDTSLGPLYTAQSKAASMQKALWHCTCNACGCLYRLWKYRSKPLYALPMWNVACSLFAFIACHDMPMYPTKSHLYVSHYTTCEAQGADGLCK